MLSVSCPRHSRSECLCLTRPRNRPVLTSRHRRAIGHGLGAAVGQRARHRRNLKVLHLNRSLLARVPTRPSALARFLVRRQVERDEEQEVRADDGNSREGRKLFTRAAAHVGRPGEIGVREVGVRSEVDEPYDSQKTRNG